MVKKSYFIEGNQVTETISEIVTTRQAHSAGGILVVASIQPGGAWFNVSLHHAWSLASCEQVTQVGGVLLFTSCMP